MVEWIIAVWAVVGTGICTFNYLKTGNVTQMKKKQTELQPVVRLIISWIEEGNPFACPTPANVAFKIDKVKVSISWVGRQRDEHMIDYIKLDVDGELVETTTLEKMALQRCFWNAPNNPSNAIAEKLAQAIIDAKKGTSNE